MKGYFYEQIESDLGWCLYSLVLHKKKLPPQYHTVIPVQLYNHLIFELTTKINFNNFDSCKEGSEVISFNEELVRYLKRSLSWGTPIYIKHECPINNSGLQFVIFLPGVF